jgi:uncharacterized membrane protein YagU involved in acid resistance
MANDHDHDHSHKDSVELPAPTAWPMTLAFGITLMGAGVVTHYTVSIVGLIIALRSVVGWWRQVIPVEEHEWVPLVPLRERPLPVSTAGRSVATVHVLAKGHQNRHQIPFEVHPYTAGIWGGLGGAVVMAGLACLYGLIAQHSLWYPINLLAAMILPSISGSSVEALRTFNGAALGIASIAHILISMLVGVLYAVTLPMFPRHAPLWAGFAVPLFWSGLLAATLNLTNPVLNQRVNWVWFVICQLGFGAVAGFIAAKTQRIETRQDLSFYERAAFEGGRGAEGEDKR